MLQNVCTQRTATTSGPYRVLFVQPSFRKQRVMMAEGLHLVCLAKVFEF